MKQKGTTWIDHNGKEVPTYAIRRVLKTEEKHSHKIAEAALLAEKYLCKVVELTRKAYPEIYDEKCRDAEIYNHKQPTEGMTISSFDNSVEVKITKPENVYFDKTFTKMVKDKFEESFNSMGNDDDMVSFFRDIVNDLLFSTKGSVDMSKVLILRKHRDTIKSSKIAKRYAILFVEAVDLFDKGIRTKPGNTGIYVSVKNDNGVMRKVLLKYSDIQ
jgi:hypothetical protein